MDRFLCRAWDEEDKKMYYNVNIFEVNFLKDEVAIIRFSEFPDLCVVSNDYEHLMMCTYLKDKNEKFIYEGDIIRTWWQHCGVTNYDYEIIGVITYSKGIAGFAINSELYSGSLNSHDDNFLHKDKIEIIGNIYENPEMKKWLWHREP